MLTLLDAAGEFVAEDVWWRVAQICTNSGPALQVPCPSRHARARRSRHAMPITQRRAP